ncbi:MAG: sodium:solute symporter [Chloroflexi bacterium]|nr:sodium:solute symporter [Chloroflexota bacterium]OJV91901.1 MAG: sodium:solute symporter [Chloroflexi bacterium 54-19]
MNWEAFLVFAFFFILVTVLGFVAARWRRGDLSTISEWGLAGRRFGTVVTWFLLGGDLYTAYTFIAVPAAMYGIGALNGFFAVPYTILVYPLIYLIMPRFWSVCKQHNYVTAADFVKDRFGSRGLALAVSFTGILATMPYIALQMFGIQISLAALGVPLTFNIAGLDIDIPLLVAFLILAAYTYTSGLRAPAMIALVKDIMIFIVLFATIIIIPSKLGGFGNIFSAAQAKAQTPGSGFNDLLASGNYVAYTTLALGSAVALFLYPHSQLGVLASNERRVIKRNAALLPIYSLMLGFLALLGYMAIAAKVTPLAGFGANGAIPALINQSFPSWFAGFAFAAISIGALVPAAAMSIAAANTFTRNIYVEFIRPKADLKEESQVAKLVSFVVKFGALLFIVYIPTVQVINYQLLGGIWIMQILPAVFLGLYTRWFNRWALLIGWLAGMVAGTTMFIVAGQKSIYAIFGIPMYEAVSAVVLNLVLAAVLTPVFEAIGARRGSDATHPSDYLEAYAPVEPLERGEQAFS